MLLCLCQHAQSASSTNLLRVSSISSNLCWCRCRAKIHHSLRRAKREPPGILAALRVRVWLAALYLGMHKNRYCRFRLCLYQEGCTFLRWISCLRGITIRRTMMRWSYYSTGGGWRQGKVTDEPTVPCAVRILLLASGLPDSSWQPATVPSQNGPTKPDVQSDPTTTKLHEP